jgi:NADP-dependent 3-hydroxy acid dehydrogenase YdfG
MGRRALELAGDVTNEIAAESFVNTTIERLGRLDILVNSAGLLIELVSLEESSMDAWRQMFEVNLMGSLYTSKAAFAHMRRQSSGHIVNISSASGRRAYGAAGAYCASKFGITGLTEVMRQEGAPLGIRVGTIEPGSTRTELHTTLSDATTREAVRDRLHGDGAMEAEDVADAVIFMVTQPPRVNIDEILLRPAYEVAGPGMMPSTKASQRTP